jgi:hypothetical protein
MARPGRIDRWLVRERIARDTMESISIPIWAGVNAWPPTFRAAG